MNLVKSKVWGVLVGKGSRVIATGVLCVLAVGAPARSADLPKANFRLDIPDAEIVAAYQRAATQNVLPAVNPKVFYGYFCVCADGQGFGYGNTYPGLDGHQLTDALLFLREAGVVQANFDYVRKFQRPSGQLPMVIFPSAAGTKFGPPSAQTEVDERGAMWKHWVPGDPLRSLAFPTYVQNADVIYRHTLDRQWLLDRLPSLNLAADYYIGALVTRDGAVGGGGYYVEFPIRLEYDGVSQCCNADAFRRLAALNALAGNQELAQRYHTVADRIIDHFRSRFWLKDHFAEYIHPKRGVVSRHGLTDVDWAAIATGAATAEQIAILWPQLKDEKRFYYGGMPTGIATLPDTYEEWEVTFKRNPLFYEAAAMGRVWYLESWARARMGDAKGLVESIRKVCEVGRKSGYYWHERYVATGPYGAQKYCEYPANLIRIVQRFLLGAEFALDGTLSLMPTAPEEFWNAGFGQTLAWRGRTLSYRMQHDRIVGDYAGPESQRLCLKPPPRSQGTGVRAFFDGRSVGVAMDGDRLVIVLPAAAAERPCHFQVRYGSP